MNKIILHIDFDSFFASVEQQDSPHLRGIPMGVTAQNGRNCIIAASREAKRLGIKGGSRRHDALKICPTMQFVSADFVKYWKTSKQFIKICGNYSPFIEVFSIDELFLDITMTAHLFGGSYGLITSLKKKIKEEIGEYITVSVGISHNKLLAKLASGFKKPDGIFEIRRSQVPFVYKKAKLTDICGIGFRIEKRLHQMGIFTLTQLSNVPLPALIAEFGNVEGNFLYNVGRGEDISIVKSFSHFEQAKSVSRNYCLPNNEYDDRIVLQNIYELYEELGIKLRRLKLKARHVGIYLRGQNNFDTHKTFSHYFDTGGEMFNLFMYLLGREPEFDTLPMNTNTYLWKNIFQKLHYVRQISVWVSFLAPIEETSINMFYDSLKQERLMRTIDNLNERYGNHTVRNGFLLYAHKLTTVPNGFMADRYERMKLTSVGL